MSDLPRPERSRGARPEQGRGALPRLSIVIVTYNSTGQIDGCLGSLIAHPPRIDHEIVVIDNASTDGTAAAIRSRWTAVHVIDAQGREYSLPKAG